MKNLDEALDSISDKRGSQAVTETYDRYESLMKEMLQNPRYRTLIHQIVGRIITQVGKCDDQDEEAPVRLTFHNVAYALVTGLILGIEMEKAE